MAERLVNVDLLDKASDVLSHQVKFRLKGEEKLASVKLALIRLIARDLKAPLARYAIAFTPMFRLRSRMTGGVFARGRVRACKANDTVRSWLAISAEKPICSEAIYFREQNWGEAGKVYQRLVGDPPVDGASIDSELGRTVLLQAVALKLNKDEEGLRQLFEMYGPGMRASPLAATFDYIASRRRGGVRFRFNSKANRGCRPVSSVYEKLS